MSIQDKRQTCSETGFEGTVIRYLREHPDFFVRWPGILEELQIPHPCGRSVSLIEYQVTVLRDQVHALKRQLQELVTHARSNEAVTERMHRLTLGLIECRRVADLFAVLYQSLLEDFRVDAAIVKLFVAPRLERDRGRCEFVAEDPRARALFENVLKARDPVCGRLRATQLTYLFGEQHGEMGSGALLPLGERDCIGFLAIASRDLYRFQPGIGTAFLKHLAEIVSRQLSSHLTPG